jgi:hypothetical protein
MDFNEITLSQWLEIAFILAMVAAAFTPTKEDDNAVARAKNLILKVLRK